jgi:hypothetical protein
MEFDPVWIAWKKSLQPDPTSKENVDQPERGICFTIHD